MSQDGLQLVGSAHLTGGRLRLTPNAQGQAGAAWFTAKKLSIADGFDLTYVFQVYGWNWPGPADGLAFVIQNHSPSALGVGGGGIGYDGIPNSVAIEFDDYTNAGEPQPHFSVQSRGVLPNSANHSNSLGWVSIGFRFSEPTRLQITYRPGSLTIFLNNERILHVNVNLADILNLDCGRAWIGFTGGTGAGVSNHDILKWYFDSVIPNDCNSNRNPDSCDLSEDKSDDCNYNSLPDECDVSSGRSPDCNRNGRPDECEVRESTVPDCNGNGVPDSCDVQNGFSRDCGGGGIPDECDIAGGVLPDCNGNGVVDRCDLGVSSLDCNANLNPDECDIRLGTSRDCNANQEPDECDATIADGLLRLLESGSGSHELAISEYGKPWLKNAGQQMRRMSWLLVADPAERLRELLFWGGCTDFQILVNRATRVLAEREMLLGNEALADAIDRTVGQRGLEGMDLSSQICFQDVADQSAPGGRISTPIDESLALLRGRALSGSPASWLDDAIYYPSYEQGGSSRPTAVYNRLPPNADSFASVAYRSNYEAGSNFEVAGKYPQGHGDAYGYFLSSRKAYMDFLLRGPSFVESEAGNIEWVDPGTPGDGNSVQVPYRATRGLAAAGAALARTALQVVDWTFRRSYEEPTNGGDVATVLEDTDRERAWGAVDWARRGALGAYFNWVVACHILPEQQKSASGALGDVDRNSVTEVGELAALAGQMQERVDAATAGRNALGLLPNMVPFGINVEELSDTKGRSPYEQMSDTARQALHTVRKMLEWANLPAQRLREQGEILETFRQQVDDEEAGVTTELFKIFGYPSRQDPADNDHDPATNDVEETRQPDFMNFLMDEAAYKVRGWESRAAPGEIQLAVSDLRVAELRAQQADQALESLNAEIEDLVRFIEFRRGVGVEQLEIINKATKEKTKLIDRLKEMKAREKKKSRGIINKVVDGVTGAIEGGKTGSALGGNIGGFVGAVFGGFGGLGGAVGPGQSLGEFDIQKEMTRIDGWKEAELTRLANLVEIEREVMRLQTLIRHSPQLLVDLDVAHELESQAIGRLHASIQRGLRLVEERERVRKVIKDELIEHRHRDLAFRVFRNNALSKFESFFDLAARYVFLAIRAYAYEYADQELAAHLGALAVRELRLGNEDGAVPGLYAILRDLDANATVKRFNGPFLPAGLEGFSFQRNLFGGSRNLTGNRKQFVVDPALDLILCSAHGFATRDAVLFESSNRLPAGLYSEQVYFVRRIDENTLTLHYSTSDAAANRLRADVSDSGLGTHWLSYSPQRAFRTWLESHIVEQLEELPAMQIFAQLELDEAGGRDRGPAIVIPFSTEVGRSNIFGKGPDAPFGGDGFRGSGNIRIRNWWLRFDGVDGGAVDRTGESGSFRVFLLPIGASVVRARHNGPEVGPPVFWNVVDQWLPPPPLVNIPGDVLQNDVNPWNAFKSPQGGWFGAMKRFQGAVAQIERGGNGANAPQKQWNLAGRSVWNTQWLLVIPGGEFTSGDNAAKRKVLLKLIYGDQGDPGDNIGVTDIRWYIEAYTN